MVCLGKNFGNQFRLFKPIERIKNCWTCSTNSWFRYISFHAHAMFPTPWCTDHLTSYDMCLNVCLYAMYVCYVHTVIVAGLSRLCSLLVAGSDEEVGRVSRFMDLDGSSWSFCHKMQIKIYHISRFKKCNMYTFEVVRLSRGAKSCELLQGGLNETRLSFEDKKKRRLRFEGHGISTSKGWLRALFENRVPKIWCLTIIFPNHIKYIIYIYTYFCHLMGIPHFQTHDDLLIWVPLRCLCDHVFPPGDHGLKFQSLWFHGECWPMLTIGHLHLVSFQDSALWSYHDAMQYSAMQYAAQHAELAVKRLPRAPTCHVLSTNVSANVRWRTEEPWSFTPHFNVN